MTERQYESMAHRDVTRMAKIMVAAAGGEIAIPKAWLDQNRYIDIELEQTESGGKVIYKARWLRDAPGATIDIAAQYREGYELIEDDRIRRLPHARRPAAGNLPPEKGA